MNSAQLKFLSDNQPIIDDIKQTYFELFPNSHITINPAPLGGEELVITCYLQKPDEWTNRISLNDPLSYTVFYNPVSGLWSEYTHHLTIKATSPHMAYGSAKLRKQTIRQANHTKIKARFKRLKQFIIDNADNMMHDTTGKI